MKFLRAIGVPLWLFFAFVDAFAYYICALGYSPAITEFFAASCVSSLVFVWLLTFM